MIAGRIHGEKAVYNQLEDVHGRMSVLHDGDIVVGALGHRNALQGYEGVLPARVAAGDRLHLLNLGGVMGALRVQQSRAWAPRSRWRCWARCWPSPVRQPPGPARLHPVLGPAGQAAARQVPVVFVAGTCMNAGKTLAACALVRAFSQAGFRVGGAKLTGVSLMRDILAMQDYGAEAILDFTDAGVACTGPATAAPGRPGHLRRTGRPGRGPDRRRDRRRHPGRVRRPGGAGGSGAASWGGGLRAVRQRPGGGGGGRPPPEGSLRHRRGRGGRARHRQPGGGPLRAVPGPDRPATPATTPRNWASWCWPRSVTRRGV